MSASAARDRWRADVAAVVLCAWFLLAASVFGGAPRAGAADLPPSGAAAAEQAVTVAVGPEPDGSAVTLDVSVFTPQGGGPYPAVLLAHGFGGSKADLAERARDLVSRGYVVLTYSARGFGQSGGRIHMDAPSFEVADARVLVDLLAARPDVRADAPGDPRIAVVGASYGGALALMAAASDRRIDAVVAAVTWHDLADAFFPQFATSDGTPASPADVASTDLPGPFKQLWASRFFGSAAGTVGPLCGRFDPTVCRLFLAAAETGEPSAQLLELLRAHSPKPLLAGLRAPTLLVQGMADSLFGLEHADATATTLLDQGTPVAVRWIDGGHDSTSSTASADEDALRAWLSAYLSVAPGETVTMPQPGFVYAAPIPRRSTTAPLWSRPTYAEPTTWTSLPLTEGPAQTVLTPPGAEPPSVTSIPGLGALAGVAAYQLAALPGQSAAFGSQPLTQQVRVAGTPRVRFTVTSTGTRVTLFLSLWQVTNDTPTLPRRLVAPVSLDVTPGVPTPVTIALAPATWTFEAGSTIRLLVTSTDSGFTVPRSARADQVALTEFAVEVPEAAGERLPGQESEVDRESVGLAVAIAVLLAGFGAAAARRRSRRRHEPHRPDLAEVPLVVTDLVKTYADGHRAVDDVSWRADQGQVVGLLGPNGAGKTTTLRMVMGLIAPDSGSVHVMGEPVSAGAPVLRRVGALVEGPGFLPHLTGRANLHAYWAATGRPPEQARFEEVLEVAALGGAIDRPVRSYSHGMRQRLGIAQAMLGLPELLVLDEPTNGLDPPQIAAMRPILHRYAAAGRTVVISSHLLAEVELTCSHVVVMHAGRVVTTGTVAELVDSSDTTVVLLAAGSQVQTVAERILAQPGIDGVDVEDDPIEPRLTVTSGMPRADVVRAVAAAGADVVGVTSRKHLEEVFLGVIATAQGSAVAGTGQPTSVTDRLRQVRAR